MSQHTIVLAEDDQFLLRGYTMALNEANFIVAGVSNGAEVIPTVEEHQPDLLLLDLIMPNMTGFDILAELRARDEFKALPIIVATGLGQDEDKEKVLNLGATDYFIKAHSTAHALVEKVNEYLS